jgi:hypothetical protein
MQHYLGDNLLGMNPFLPDLVVAPGLGRLLIILQLIQDPGLLILLQLGDEALGGVALEIPDDISQFRPSHKQVQVIIQDGIGIDFQAFMLAAELEGVDEDVKVGFPGEDGDPFDHRAGDEVGDSGLSNRISASHGAKRRQGGEAELRRKMAFPSRSLGTREEVLLIIPNFHEECRWKPIWETT